MVRCCYLAVLLCLGVTALALGADEPMNRTVLPGETPSTTRRLEAAGKLAAEAKWSETVDEYQRLLDEAGDDLVPVTPHHSLQARWLCHLRLAALPPAALRLYRERIEDQARKWLEQGTAARDPRMLRRVVEEAFCSRSTEQALDTLGDLAFERGAFDEAERWWRLLATPASAASAGPVKRADRTSVDLVFPDPQCDLAGVRAKQILALMFRGERDGFQHELDAFRKLYGKAEGHLAGRDGVYAEILTSLASQAKTLAAPPQEETWPCFAGDPSRSRVLPGDPHDPERLSRLWVEEPWRFSLEDRERIKEGGPEPALADKDKPAAQEARSLAFHPVIMGDQAVVADARYVTAYDLRKGTAAVWYDLERVHDIAGLELGLPAKADLRYSLTVADNCVYARLGAQAMGPRENEKPEDKKGQSYLVCLQLSPEAAGVTERWWAAPAVPNKEGAVFEGAPVVREGRAYIAATRFVAGQAVTAIHCYPTNARGMALPLWRQDICSALEPREKDGRYRHHLLTLAGPSCAAGVITRCRACFTFTRARRITRHGCNTPPPRKTPTSLNQ